MPEALDLPRMRAERTAKLQAQIDFLEWFSFLVQVLYQYDPNQTRLQKAEDGTSIRKFSNPNLLGFNFSLQAKY